MLPKLSNRSRGLSFPDGLKKWKALNTPSSSMSVFDKAISSSVTSINPDGSAKALGPTTGLFRNSSLSRKPDSGSRSLWSRSKSRLT